MLCCAQLARFFSRSWRLANRLFCLKLFLDFFPRGGVSEQERRFSKSGFGKTWERTKRVIRKEGGNWK
ncbi:hypothetical protein EGQ50_01475 [Coxiella endosymbiont of Amblyomma sculptum]|nr:hypothetical protein EGQ50_01475 [Coxiella endosymbiont of Amblyomma sculptum]